jgi:4-amino-4-deoxy-L-arabinose transferase-like glycosyltransferase
MFVLEPLFSLLLLCLILHRKNRCFRHSVLSAAIVWAVLLVAMTEVLSLFRSLTFSWVSGLWGIVSLILCFISLRFNKNVALIGRLKFANTSPMSRLLLLWMFLIIATVGLIAWVAPPNTTDSMSYHMSRVAHWIENQTVSHYPTNILRQLYLTPGSEFIITHFQILSGGDRLANFVQWFSMVGSACGVSLIAKQLGAGARGQVLAAVVVTTIPMGILQASSTQNDYVVSFWLTCFVYFLILLKSKEVGQPIWPCSLAVGASLGLAILTKGTAYIFALPFLLWFTLSSIKKSRQKLGKSTLIIATIALSINFAHYARNFDLFGAPLGPGQEGAPGSGLKVTNDVFSVSTLISNSARNIALEMGTPFERLNVFTEKAIYKLHSLMDLSVNDPRTTWRGTQFSRPNWSLHEDFAGNPVHLACIVLSVVVFVASRQLRGRPYLVCYCMAVTGGFLLFSLLLRWQPWNARLHLPLFVLWSPFIAAVLSRSQKLGSCFAVGLLISAFPWVVHNKSRPLTGSSNIFNTSRINLYFSNRKELRDPYTEATDFIRSQKCSQVGLLLDDWEYPLWVLLRGNNNTGVKIAYVDVANNSAAKYESKSIDPFSASAIVSVYCEHSKEAAMEARSYNPAWMAGPVKVLLKPRIVALDCPEVDLNPNPWWSGIGAGLGKFKERRTGILP